MKKIIVITGFFGLFIGSLASASAGYFNADPIIRCEERVGRLLRLGSENNDVYTLQTILFNAGFLGATPNGYFGHQTVAAVKQFQLHNGIMRTGFVGEETREAINSLACDGRYTNNITQVGSVDPYVRVISPTEQAPAIYATPQKITHPVKAISSNTYSSPSYVGSVNTQVTSVPAFSSSQIASTNIVYNPSTGYSYGITPRSGSITVSSPVANAIYNEGDTVYVRWATNNINSSVFSIVLESSITGQKTTVATLSGSAYSFVLSKELLDSVCSGTCNNNQQGSFKISVTSNTTDIAGLSTVLRAPVAPITVRRPLAAGTLTVSTSQSPVNSNEAFKLYVNIPQDTLNTSNMEGYSVRIKAVCPSVVTVSIAGASCGQEFMAPMSAVISQSGIPVKAINQTWYKQEVVFQVALVNPLGQITASSEAKTVVNSSPFSW